MEKVALSTGKNALIGAAVGAPLSAWHSYRTAKLNQKEKRKNVLKPKGSAIVGGITGALGGALIGARHNEFADQLNFGKHFEKAKHRHIGTALGAASGAAIYGGGAAAGNKLIDATGDKTQHKADVASSAAMGAVAGGYTGRMLGRMYSQSKGWKAYRSGEGKSNYDEDYGGSSRGDRGGRYGGGGYSRPSAAREPPEWAKGAKTKAEAKKAYRDAAIKNHPDKGGSEEVMKKINSDWDEANKPGGWATKLSAAQILALLNEMYRG